MMQRRKSRSIDGFTVHKPGTDRPGIPEQYLRRPQSGERPVLNSEKATKHHDTKISEESKLSHSEISDSLRAFDNDIPKKSRRRRFRISKKKIFLFVAMIALIAGLYFGIKIVMTSSKLFSGNIFDLVGAGATLKADEYGRTNILVFGTSEDDPAHEDAGANLTDSIMVISVDQKAKNAAMISVPRDLWVKYGKACLSGYEGKINVVYECNSDDGANEPDGAKALMDVVGEHYGLDLQYYAHVNYSVVRDTVNAVGGVTVEIDSDDSRGILDRNFDWACNYKCHYVKWPNGPATLNGDQALALARARNAAGGYGLGGGNFDREQYQQKIIMALKDKAASAGTLANPVAMSNILDALGNNVRTNFSAGEVKTLMTLAGDIPSAEIKRVSLVEEGKAVLTTGDVSGQSVVRPVEGLYDFSEVRRYVRAKLTVSATSGEEPSILVLNGSDYAGLASKKAAELNTAGFVDVETGDVPSSSDYGDYVWYDLSNGKKPQALAKLTSILGSNPISKNAPAEVQSTADFVIIIGNGAN